LRDDADSGGDVQEENGPEGIPSRFADPVPERPRRRGRDDLFGFWRFRTAVVLPG
jgi:hypothetical protein